MENGVDGEWNSRIGCVLTGFEGNFTDEDPFVLEPQFDHDMLGGAVLQVDVYDPRVFRHPVLLGLVGYIVLLPALPF